MLNNFIALKLTQLFLTGDLHPQALKHLQIDKRNLQIK